jgi:hypothetical protein
MINLYSCCLEHSYRAFQPLLCSKITPPHSAITNCFITAYITLSEGLLPSDASPIPLSIDTHTCIGIHTLGEINYNINNQNMEERL